MKFESNTNEDFLTNNYHLLRSSAARMRIKS